LEHAVKTATNSKYIYVKQGSYPVDFSIQNNDCGKLLAYPGHEVTLIGSGNGNSRISLKGAGEYIFQGFNCDVNSTRWFFSVDTSLLSNLIIRKNNMFNIDDSSRENPAFMFFWDGSKKPINGEEHYKNIIVQENIFHDLRNTNNHGASVVLYDVQDMIYEDNIIYDIDGNGIIDKDDGFRNTFRNNLIYDCLTGIALLNQYSQGSIDVCYNLVYNCDKAAVIGAQPGYLKDVFLHHNTLIDGISFGAVLNRNSNCSNINVYNNVIGRHGDEYPYQFVPIKVMDTETAYHYEYPAYVQDPSDETVRIDKNLIWVKSENDISGYGWGLTKMNLTQWHNAMYDSNGIVADPGLDTDYSLPLTSGYYGEYGRDNKFIRTAGVSVQQVQDTNIYYVSPDATSTDWAAARNINSPCTIQTAFDNAQAGDTVQFRGGIYNVPVRSSGTWLTGYYAPNHSGTEEAPIVFMAYPGETPVFDGKQGGVDRDGHGYYHHATIMSNARYTGSGTSFHEYITFDGFTFQCDGGVNEARIALTGGDNYFKGQRVRGLVVQNCTFNGGTWDNEARINGVGGTGDNHEGIFISQVTGLVIRNCRIFDYNHTQNNQNTSGIKTYHSDNVIIENCEIFDCTRGIYSKSNTDDLTVRYNYIHDCNEGFFAGTSGWWNDANDHTKGYHVSENSNNVLHNNLFTNIKRGPVSGFTQDGGDLDRMVI
jgi:parallel beta-helix repeat protein